MHYFDLDGTLVETYEATRLAYLEAGAAKFGEDEWGRSASDWGCPKEVHLKKHQIFPEILKRLGVRAGWAYAHWESVPSKERIILSGATLPTVQAIHSVFPELGLNSSTVFLGCSLQEKVRVLSTPNEFSVFYYEDQISVATKIRSLCPNVKVITQ